MRTERCLAPAQLGAAGARALTANRSGLLLCVQTVSLYLVKWCSLPYEDSTWELKADIDQSKIEEYQQIAAQCPSTKRVVSSACCLTHTHTHTLCSWGPALVWLLLLCSARLPAHDPFLC